MPRNSVLIALFLHRKHIEEISNAFAAEDRYSIFDDAQLITVGRPVLIGDSYLFTIDFHLSGVVLRVSPVGDGWDVEEPSAWIA